MKIKIERNKKNKPPGKKKKTQILHVGKKSKAVTIMWSILIISIIFGIFNNVTAIDKHTIHEKVVEKERIVNTSGIENFTIEFARLYFSWSNDKKIIEERSDLLKSYMTEENQLFAQEMVREDIPTSCEVQLVKILDVANKKEKFTVDFEVTEFITEGEKKSYQKAAYAVDVYQDGSGNHVVTSLPTMITRSGKANYQPDKMENDATIETQKIVEMTTFLETFFKLYPKANDKELEYYVEKNVLDSINYDLTFVELNDPVFIKKGDHFIVKTYVKYLENVTKTTQVYEFELEISKKENWKIIS